MGSDKPKQCCPKGGKAAPKRVHARSGKGTSAWWRLSTTRMNPKHAKLRSAGRESEYAKSMVSKGDSKQAMPAAGREKAHHAKPCGNGDAPTAAALSTGTDKSKQTWPRASSNNSKRV